ncbi:hypothetical protein Pan216_05730 [Planctomycetes bacterium Pan216]|uniref:Uncharacterized protein n=1 Tax=Kolteria novifilia TaxID=2527975 RepID=A0A518AYD7_9BACT|nr:hypothetical protein Pan216_05730 [Planctomycetes bacterium Pan216]
MRPSARTGHPFQRGFFSRSRGEKLGKSRMNCRLNWRQARIRVRR